MVLEEVEISQITKMSLFSNSFIPVFQLNLCVKLSVSLSLITVRSSLLSISQFLGVAMVLKVI